jgi:hypothetical protein
MKRSHNEKGTALIFATILALVLSVMAASLMFLSQSETWSSLNYRLMTQARYGAEAGIHAAANYIVNSYTAPASTGTDLISLYDRTKSPVTLAAGGVPILLSSMSGQSTNYPVAAVGTSFATATNKSLTAGGNTVNYTATAQLVSMRQIQVCSKAQYVTAQTWLLTAHGDVSAARNAEVEVSALLEAQVTPCYNYAAFATGSGCGEINWSGGGPVDSYDSGNMAFKPNGDLITQSYDGNLGSNGNINAGTHTQINGTFTGPLTGVGACSSGDAFTGNSNQISGCETSATNCGSQFVQLSQPAVYTSPTVAYPTGVVESTLTSPNGGSISPNNCLGGTAGCYGDVSGGITLMPFVDPVTHACSGGTYYINTLSITGNNSLTIGTCPAGTLPISDVGATRPLAVNIVDVNNAGFSLSGNSVANNTLNAANLQILYAGTGPIALAGNSTAALVLYAPNAALTIDGSKGAIYGSVIANSVTMNGNKAALHYDRRLSVDLLTVSNWTLDSFNWSKF